MKNLPTGFLAAQIASLIESGEIKMAADAARYLGCNHIRAAEIYEWAVEKASQRQLDRFPKPNHDNQMKEWNR